MPSTQHMLMWTQTLLHDAMLNTAVTQKNHKGLPNACMMCVEGCARPSTYTSNWSRQMARRVEGDELGNASLACHDGVHPITPTQPPRIQP